MCMWKVGCILESVYCRLSSMSGNRSVHSTASTKLLITCGHRTGCLQVTLNASSREVVHRMPLDGIQTALNEIFMVLIPSRNMSA
jgi:hypothetical protein